MNGKKKGSRWGHPLLLPMRGYRGCGHPVATAARMVRILHFGKLFITFITEFCISFRGDEELLIYIFSIFTGIRSLWLFGLLGEGLHQRVVAHLAHDEVAELWPRTPYSQIKYSEQLAPVGLLRVEVESVLAHRCGVVGRADTLLFLSRVVVPDFAIVRGETARKR